MKKSKFAFFIALFFISCISERTFSTVSMNTYDTSRIYNTMAKARAGDTVNIVTLGGSITAGALASHENKRWANLVYEWWKTTFPSATINLINKGIGGTGSDVGTFRVQDDVIKYNPDFVVVEFAVNDEGKNPEYVKKMMEGIVRQLLKTNTAVMFLLLKTENGGTAQADHKVIGNYYKIPMISYADLIDPSLLAEGKSLRDVYGDNPGVHPNDPGMQYIADFIIDELNLIYKSLPEASDIPMINTNLPAPLTSDIYQFTSKYCASDLIPVKNSGWTISDNWTAETVNSEIEFEISGSSIAVQYSRHNSQERGQVEIWVDDHTPKILDAYWTEWWGPATVFYLLEEGLDDTKHTLHLKVLQNTSSGGHTFYLLNILKAGATISTGP